LKPLLILCLGNEIISDDSFGPTVAVQLRTEARVADAADIVFAPVAGFHLLDLLAGRKKVLIVDTIVTGKSAPGTLHVFPAGIMTPSLHLTTSHQISLPTALDLGKKLGMEMPEVVDVCAVEAQDLETLSEEMTPVVRGAMHAALLHIREWVTRQNASFCDPQQLAVNAASACG
jgi:hydrogenase maturation protease